MDRNLRWKGLFILGVIGLGIWTGFPIKDKINFGLDLQGGMHLVLQVQTVDALRTETDKSIDQLQQELEDLDLKVEVDRLGDTSFAVTGIPDDTLAKVDEDVLKPYMNAFWDHRQEGGRMVFEMLEGEQNNVRELAVRQALETIRNRIDAFGVAEPVIHREGIGGDRIVVQLPGVDDPKRVKDLIGKTALLEFRLSHDQGPAKSEAELLALLGGSLPKGYMVLKQDLRDENKRVTGTQYWAIESRLVISGRDLKTALPSQGEFNEPTVRFTLTREGGRKFGDVTEANRGRRLAIILDNKVISAPVIQSRITDEGVIHGDFTFEEVQDLVTTLRSGSLPASIVYLEERTVGPTLGADSIAKGLNAGVLGSILVVLCMLLVYRLSGVNAILALSFNIVLIFAALAILPGATLTLPGIAGIVLTVGMAVDANVLVFERIREELRAGRTVRSAIDAGFAKALSSILDGNITTLIAAMFMFTFGTGPIKGFGVTLSIGIFASVFTAVFVSRWMFDVVYGKKLRAERISIG